MAIGVRFVKGFRVMPKPAAQMPNEIKFLAELRNLLDRYDVDLVATDDGASHGQQLPLIQIQFNGPYAVYEFTSISSDDEVADDQSFKVSS